MVFIADHLNVFVKNSDERLVHVAAGFLLGGKGDEATFAHLLDIGELLVDVAEGEGGDVLLVGDANGVVVVEVRVPANEDMVDSRAQQARDFEFEQLGELIRDEG